MSMRLSKILLLLVIVSAFVQAKSVYFDGYTSYSGNGPNHLNLRSDLIVNKGQYHTGTLKLQLWAMSYKYQGGRIRGYVVAEANLGNIQGRQYFSNIRRTVPLKRPPRGIYNMTLVLLEYQQGGFKIVDYINYKTDERF